MNNKIICFSHKLTDKKQFLEIDDAAQDCLVIIDNLPESRNYDYQLSLSGIKQLKVNYYPDGKSLPTYRPSIYTYQSDYGKLVFSGDQYTQLDLLDGRRIYLAIEHSAAYFFGIKDFQEGFINGQETLMHIDADGHVDSAEINIPDSGKQLPSIKDSLQAHFDYIYPFYTETGVHIGNYVTALKQQFSRMSAIYLYGYHHDSFYYKAPDDPTFQYSSNILQWQDNLEGKQLVTSIDIDIFADVVRDEEEEIEDQMMTKISEIARESKVVHLILSPSFMTPNRIGGELIGELLERIVANN